MQLHIIQVILLYIEYFNLITESLHISAFLDPRYKKYCFPTMNSEEILAPIRKKINEQLPLSVAKPKKVSSFYQKLKYTSQQTQILDDEVQKYWLSAEADENINLLNWWNTHTAEYPTLSELAHNYLCIQASSVPCEQLFSIAGQIINKSRNRLDSESARACLCLHSWLSKNIK